MLVFWIWIENQPPREGDIDKLNIIQFFFITLAAYQTTQYEHSTPTHWNVYSQKSFLLSLLSLYKY